MALPKAQEYPASKIKVGAVLYIASSDTDEDRKTTTEIQEWVVRSIRAKRGSKSRYGIAHPGATDVAKYVNVTQKLEHVSWGKCSRKNGDYGWLKSIPTWATRQFRVGAALPLGMYTTPRAALIFAINRLEESILRNKQRMAEESVPSEIEEWQRYIEDTEAEVAALKRRLTKLTTKV